MAIDLRPLSPGTHEAFRLSPGYSSPLPELPESVCVAAGMILHKDHPECPVYRRDFARIEAGGVIYRQ